MPMDQQPKLKIKIFHLMDKYEFSPDQIKICVENMHVVQIKIKKELVEPKEKQKPEIVE